MSPRDFCYWLQGLFELGEPATLDVRQTELVRRHLALVFKHSIDAPDPSGVLQAIHDGVVSTNPAVDVPGTVYRC